MFVAIYPVEPVSMKVSLNWTKRYVDIDCAVTELVDRLTNIGLNVEEIIELPDDVVLDLEVPLRQLRGDLLSISERP